jgi:putative ABC transport system permease protein
MLRLALKMLFGDTAKYLMLVAGIAVATFLMAQQTAVFCGLMNWTKSTLKNVPAPIWVVEEKVEQVNETNPLLDTDVARVRSVSSVAWASPIYSGMQRVRLENGNFKMIQLIGIDSNTLAGAPAKMLEGDLMKLRLPHSVIIDDLGVTRLARKRGDKVKVGDMFELNDQEARVVGIADAMTSFTRAIENKSAPARPFAKKLASSGSAHCEMESDEGFSNPRMPCQNRFPALG